MKNITFKKGEVIFREGEIGNVMYDILSGKVGVYMDFETDSERMIAELEAGQTVGEMGLIEVWPRSATAVALEDGTTLAEIGESELESYFVDKPEKLFALMKLLSARLRETTQKYVDVCRIISEREDAETRKDIEKRIALQREMDYYSSFYYSNWMH
jgi:CRP-like cAMP-binding protein